MRRALVLLLECLVRVKVYEPTSQEWLWAMRKAGCFASDPD
jgi:hypothetical protein